MKNTFFLCQAIFFIASFSLPAQDKLGLALVNGKILQAKDTISLSYPSESVIILCGLFDANKNMLGRIAVKWSVSGNLTFLDNAPMVSDRLIIEASQALFDQQGYLSAQASDPDVQWINNKVFIMVKGKNSGVIQCIVFPEIQNHCFRAFDLAGRLQRFDGFYPSRVFIMHDKMGKERIKAITIK
jgi:hypothetical protein